MTSLLDTRVSWLDLTGTKDRHRTGILRALAYDQVAQAWTALVEPDDGEPFRDLPAVTLRPVRGQEGAGT